MLLPKLALSVLAALQCPVLVGQKANSLTTARRVTKPCNSHPGRRAKLARSLVGLQVNLNVAVRQVPRAAHNLSENEARCGQLPLLRLVKGG